MSDPIIKVEGVSKSYGGVKANVDITMGVERGSITNMISTPSFPTEENAFSDC